MYIQCLVNKTVLTMPGYNSRAQLQVQVYTYAGSLPLLCEVCCSSYCRFGDTVLIRICTCPYIRVYIYVLLGDEKEGRKKQTRSNKQQS